MAINKEVSFTDAVTVVDASWLNLLQEHLAGLVTGIVDTPTATQVRIFAGSDDEVVAIYIGGQQRFRDTSTNFTFVSEPSATYGVYVTAPDGVDSFDIEVTAGTPGVSPYRKIAEVEWNGSAISSLRLLAGRNVDHAHTAFDGSGTVAHSDLVGFGGDPHTQYSLADGSRAFTGVVGGVTPTADLELATKSYVDGLESGNPGLPIGTILPVGGSDIPSGWKLCDGASYDTTAEADLFAITAYVFGGAGSNFNVPDLRERFPMGKTAAGTGSTLGGTGGAWDHDHSTPSHTHTGVAHTHSSPSHTHSFPTTSSNGSHSHTQGSTGSNGAHTHTGPSHTHTASSYSVGELAEDAVGATHSSQNTIGIYSYDVLNRGASSTSHSHGAGSYTDSSWGALCGSSASRSVSHTHAPAGHSYRHKHPSGAVSGNTSAAGTGSTTSNGGHTHTNPTTSTASSHAHGGGTSGSAARTTNSSGGGLTSSAGGASTGSENPPHLAINYVIRAS